MPVWEHGENRHGVQEDWQFRNRTYTAQVRGVDTLNGTITVDLIGSRERYTVDIPAQISASGITSSWARSMPSVNDYVEIGFGPRNNAYAIRMTTWNLGKDNGGYKLLSDAAAKGIGSLDLIFRELKQGEHDLRSSGGAGYFFTQDGHAAIEAGPTNIQLDKNRSESVGEAGMWHRFGDGVDVRYGDVKRIALPTDFEESIPPPNPASMLKPKEWRVELSVLSPPLGTPKLTYYTEEAGDIRDDTGLIPQLQSGTGLPLRYRKTLQDATGLVPVLTVEVDVRGNIQVTQGVTATPAGGINIVGGATAPFMASFFKAEIDTKTSFKVAATTTCDIGGMTAVNINAGGAADSSMVRGDQLAIYFARKLSVLTAFGPSGPAVVPLMPGSELSLLAKVK
jgi:hypothetical protein